ncbi:transposase [Candidatus Nomurabacteria bacterium]|nr:transposase [Candidatus Nomurabacteria bacterium]
MARLIPFTPGEYFHIYNRGTNKMEIFLDFSDYDRFQKLLYTANSKETSKYSGIKSQDILPVWSVERGETLVDIGAYTTMPNHFHLLIRSKNEKDTALFLQRILGSYSKYFNVKNNRTGTLFQGRSKAKHIVGDKYLKYNYTYIHLNIVKLIQNNWKEVGLKDIERTKEYLKNYKYSSFLDYSGANRQEGKILNKEAFPKYFEASESFEKEIKEFLNYGNEINSIPGMERMENNI